MVPEAMTPLAYALKQVDELKTAGAVGYSGKFKGRNKKRGSGRLSAGPAW